MDRSRPSGRAWCLFFLWLQISFQFFHFWDFRYLGWTGLAVSYLDRLGGRLVYTENFGNSQNPNSLNTEILARFPVLFSKTASKPTIYNWYLYTTYLNKSYWVSLEGSETFISAIAIPGVTTWALNESDPEILAPGAQMTIFWSLFGFFQKIFFWGI